MFEGGVKRDKNNPDHISNDAIVSNSLYWEHNYSIEVFFKFIF